ncbi:MAG TPA: hypothetical protein VGS20_08670 [Candidatus Acidoferrales bacterium]|nr:hypothetical protein [Candidatus Acidoferrales bacterium]
MDAAEVTLPGGWPGKGGWHRAAVVRPATGREEAFLVERGGSLLPATRATELLSRCVRRLGSRRATPEAVRSLGVGDREALMLHLRRLTFGDRISCTLRCPGDECDEPMDLELDVGELLLPPYPHQRAIHQATVEASEGSYRVRFRLPTGADLEAAAPLAGAGDAAVNLLLERCVGEVVEQSSGRPVSALPPAVAQALPEKMAQLDPQAEILLDLTCPACGAAFIVPFDAADYFYRELCGDRLGLYRQVHLLAFHYHWSEAGILRLTPGKRRVYLELLADGLGGSESW